MAKGSVFVSAFAHMLTSKDEIIILNLPFEKLKLSSSQESGGKSYRMGRLGCSFQGKAVFSSVQECPGMLLGLSLLSWPGHPESLPFSADSAHREDSFGPGPPRPLCSQRDSPYTCPELLGEA